MSDDTTPANPSTPPRWFMRSFWMGHRALLSLTGGRVGLRRAKPDRWGMLRLQTLGRHSGQVRSAILGYLEDGDDILLLATNGMDERPPSWWLNLQTTPDAIAELPDGVRDVRAREAVGVERERLWSRWVALGGGLEQDAASMERQIPVIVLEPRPA